MLKPFLLNPPVTRNLIAAQGCQVNTGTITQDLRTYKAQFFSHPKGAISNLNFTWKQWYYDEGNGQETAVGNSTTITASIEYPSGTLTQITFNNGSTSIVCADGAQVTSDNINITIPANTKFWVRSCFSNASGKFSCTTLPTTSNHLGMSAVGFAANTDATMSGTITPSAIALVSAPTVIKGTVAIGSAKAYVITGDSIAFGQGDDASADANSGSGYIARALINKGSYLKIACPGQSVRTPVTTAHTKLQALIASINGAYTEMVCEFGTNDIRVYNNTAQLQSNLQTYWSWFNGKITQCTLGTRTSSTDGWITTGNQTILTPLVPEVNDINDWIRGLPTGCNNFVEAADQLMSARNSDLWPANNPGWTADGVHPTSIAAAAIGAAVASYFY